MRRGSGSSKAVCGRWGGSRRGTKAQEGCLGCGTPAHPPATVQRGTRQELAQIGGAPWGSGVTGTWVPASARAPCPLTPHRHSCVASPCGSPGAASRRARRMSSRSTASPLRPETHSWLQWGRSLGGPSGAAGGPDLQGPKWRQGTKRALPKLTISQSRTPNDHLKGQEPML